jgi:uncharacterized protein (TIGR03437 family)
VIAATPGIFTATGDGRSSPVIVHASDYKLVTPQNPARTGEFLTIFCTGLGVAGAGIRAGDPAPAVPVPVQITVVTSIGTVTYAGLAPGYAGLYQVNFQVPLNITAGTYLLKLFAGQASTINNEMAISNELPLSVQ